MNENIYSLIAASQQKQELKRIIDSNQYTQKFGVKLSSEDALLLLQSRKENLKKQERVEFSEGILPKLIFAFCDSPFIFQDNYVETIEALQDIFYLYKNESLDELSDDELISYMKMHFNGDCQGSLNYLEETSLEGFSKDIRKGSHRFMGSSQNEE